MPDSTTSATPTPAADPLATLTPSQREALVAMHQRHPELVTKYPGVAANAVKLAEENLGLYTLASDNTALDMAAMAVQGAVKEYEAAQEQAARVARGEALDRSRWNPNYREAVADIPDAEVQRFTRLWQEQSGGAFARADGGDSVIFDPHDSAAAVKRFQHNAEALTRFEAPARKPSTGDAG